eukprot:SAG11_NODE_9992_length_864_cov_0.686275_2_plen_159_part_01
MASTAGLINNLEVAAFFAGAVTSAIGAAACTQCAGETSARSPAPQPVNVIGQIGSEVTVTVVDSESDIDTEIDESDAIYIEDTHCQTNECPLASATPALAAAAAPASAAPLVFVRSSADDDLTPKIATACSSLADTAAAVQATARQLHDQLGGRVDLVM